MRNIDSPGSPPSSEPVFLVVGKLRRPHGVKGEIILEVMTDFPERLKAGVSLYVGPERRPVKLASSRWHGQFLLVSFEGYHTPEQVGELRNLFACVLAADRPALPDGEYYHHQLLGMQVITQLGQVLGTIREILVTGANDVFVVRSWEGPETLVPWTDEVVKKIDLEKKQLIIEPLPGLLPGEE